VRTVALPATPSAPRRSKRLLALADDDRLLRHIRGGSEPAFEVVFERYGKGILSFCRHMLGSQEEAEDAVQHTFASAYRDLQRDTDREVRLKPWLYTIARNRCLSILRARREQVQLDRDLATAGLAEQVEQRAELRDLLRDIGDLPAEQRAALLLAEVGDLSQADIGQVLDCEAAKVKALVFRARSSLIERRDARATPCEEIREQLSVLSGGSLRRSGIRHHLRHCQGCREYREEVKRQRQMMAVALPVIPSAWLKAHVLGAAGSGSAATAGSAGVAAAGAGAGAAAPVGTAVVAKVAVLAVLAGAGGVATQAAIDRHDPSDTDGSAQPSSSSHRSNSAESGFDTVDPRKSARSEQGSRSSSNRRGHSGSKHGHGKPADTPGRGPADVPGSRGQGVEHRNSHADGVPRGRGPIDAPPAHTPVQRGPAEPKTTHPTPPPPPEHPAKPETPLPGTGNSSGDTVDDG
jgi:RNA polymerase sigma factor (sigma-70 family)